MSPTDAKEVRSTLKDAERVVVKIGSKSLAADGGRFAQVAAEIAALTKAGRQIVLVSSGAIALGWTRLGLKQRPTSMALLQASAAAGQSQLMRAYEDAFTAHETHVAQVLLTHADLADRDRYLNARGAIEALLELSVVPIINENDTVAVEEIRFGDNDQLAALVATLVGADLLVLLTDVEGVLDDKGQRVSTVRDVAEIGRYVLPTKNELGTGGMQSKIEAAHRATRHGASVVIGSARVDGMLPSILAGDDVGTLFLPHGAPMASRKHWIAFTLKPKGTLVLDAGAAHAIKQKQTSLLPAGVIGVRGDFEPGDPVSLVGPEGAEIARGLSRYGVRDAARLAGARSPEIAERLGYDGGAEMVHRDDLVVL